jgi:hypothetical protein
MDPVLRLVAIERDHPFAHLGPLRTAPGPGEVLLEIPLRSRRAHAAALSAAQRLALLADLRDALSSGTEPQTP